ncbi:16S rRNA (adenine(1518)-N(6)/adenine(1519)-N(6))-dimethyltransferase RsmA [Marinobacterium sp. D7]|uniref:16S rRNA (adenine(1518)-N(6)/adenine(1519)-N(6))- dimethyltransferase RsmA n=1 Tax=Marinobacterium ramblicola TaxID=2849041 RepID=UPI001C2DDFDC|nr:16S rRNA (adenine(1518)-N(6)/adenine(1519)-N(6))-dimethyltransferase RsmA [Marinobacterium ramblicola]MBV1787330.1 16S rRNA (adenine(1518)-N(6)/adenine(1519)-N(6))-dimethyltransferase RsmA [Marinobacterium ramblicola]
MSKKPIMHKARKRFGQNFLHDAGIIRRILREINPKPGQHLVEIGPGLGALTEELLTEAGALEAVELDRDLIPVLRTKFFRYEDNFRIHEADALKFDFSSLRQDERPLRIVGNLPYNISTPLIFHLLSFSGLISDMHFMLQNEVVDRLAAQPGENHYGRLGIMAQYYCQVEKLFLVPPGAFQPAPKVDSAIVRLTPYQQLPMVAKDVNMLQEVVRTAFSQRRKTLRNNLKPLIDAATLEALGIDPQLRPERLSLAEFISISDAITAGQQEEN